jgi:hypothetical protein
MDGDQYQPRPKPSDSRVEADTTQGKHSLRRVPPPTRCPQEPGGAARYQADVGDALVSFVMGAKGCLIDSDPKLSPNVRAEIDAA